MYEYEATVHRIVDGDTIDVIIDLGFSIHHKARIRMARIDAPESRTRDTEEKVKGIIAKDFLIQTIREENGGKVIIRTSKDKKGKFGRILAEVFCGGYNLNDLMLEKGHAVPYEGGKR